MNTPFSEEFRLSITRALGDQLADALTTLRPAPLTQDNLNVLQAKPGVYQLYLRDQFVYVGKADKSLPSRLGNHLRKLSSRRELDIEAVSFACLYVAEDFSAVAPEKLLIKRHKAEGRIPWNTNGFGNKDPGRKRDHTALKVNHFDMLHPIDLGRTVEGVTAGPWKLHELLKAVKQGLPYNFRYQAPTTFKDALVAVPDARTTADELFRLIAPVLPEDWQISALMGYAIMYEDARVDYPSGWRYYRGTDVVTSTPEAEPAGEIEEEPADE
ncbi:Eco29kI family restriction endonuclease [Actinacidiphila oryziradicis]|uniref:GIY-YIG nuclease family protein n=1 Tax=Actinacidiphila oryziradicis TaxID=2571141 RepID=A0A4U0SIG2_9ACTN|nr:Eco29kI family restriction endonuclease [Actinacidiphila oryziradicis]TKA09514.1 GIY-YIG nuclease family protein [Actinacidiphila oryziradicis]